MQDRIVGAHFFSPAHIMPLLEIVRTDETSPQVSRTARSLHDTVLLQPLPFGPAAKPFILSAPAVRHLRAVLSRH